MKLGKQLDGAKMVKFEEKMGGIVWAWFGGHGVHAYSESTGDEIAMAYGNVGDFSEKNAKREEVEEYIEEFKWA